MSNNVTGIAATQLYLRQMGTRLGSQFQDELINRVRAASVNMQKELNDSIEGGATAFTKRALKFSYYRRGNGITCTIRVMPNQLKYLREIILQPKAIDKIIPAGGVKLDSLGNIKGLKSGLASGKYKIVKSGGKERLIDTTKNTKRTKKNRVIGLKESKKRKLVWDFYQSGEDNIRMAISGIQGHFMIRRG
ncbi:hypothetical protein [Enterobacter soli]|uniref:hypothetical protein n=1 Tax=Enterobacter soli TaxID=885040 RepID=UPI004046BF3C